MYVTEILKLNSDNYNNYLNINIDRDKLDYATNGWFLLNWMQNSKSLKISNNRKSYSTINLDELKKLRDDELSEIYDKQIYLGNINGNEFNGLFDVAKKSDIDSKYMIDINDLTVMHGFDISSYISNYLSIDIE